MRKDWLDYFVIICLVVLNLKFFKVEYKNFDLDEILVINFWNVSGF